MNWSDYATVLPSIATAEGISYERAGTYVEWTTRDLELRGIPAQVAAWGTSQEDLDHWYWEVQLRVFGDEFYAPSLAVELSSTFWIDRLPATAGRILVAGVWCVADMLLPPEDPLGPTLHERFAALQGRLSSWGDPVTLTPIKPDADADSIPE